MSHPKRLSKVRQALVPFLESSTLSKTRDISRHREEATRLRHLKYREAIAKLHYTKNMSIRALALHFGMQPSKIRWYLDWSLGRVLAMSEEERKRPKRAKPRTVPGTVVSASSTSHGRSVPSSALVLSPGSPTLASSPASDPRTQKQAFFLRSNAVPSDEIAEILGITEPEANAAIYEYANRLNNSEINTVEIGRRVQIEQLDMALRAIMPNVTGEDIEGNRVEISIEAIDRFLKIMDQKAKLTGVNVPQRVDLDIRLRKIAEAGEFDYEDLQDILKEVLIDYPTMGLAAGT